MGNDSVGWLTAVQIAERGIDPRTVVDCHVDRIRRYDARVGAYIHLDPTATGGAGPLRGATLAVKDTYPVAGMPWTWASPKWRHRIAAEDAIPVARARAAGAAILGKVNLPELAAAVGTTNELFPPTHNPWREGFTPGGSSGGSAAAVAAGLCTVAFGDDMGGSIRIPSACCGVVGLRPSPDRVPTELPDPARLSVRGPLARSVADLRLTFSVMTGEPLPATHPAAALSIGVVREPHLPVDTGCREAVEGAAAALGSAHRLGDVGWESEEVARSYQVVRPASVSPLPGDPVDYGAAAGRLIAEGRRVSASDYLAALTGGLLAVRPLKALLAQHDAILTPTLGRLPMPIAEVPPFLSEDWLDYTEFMLPVSYAGLPAVSVPAGLADGLPVGVQLIGRPGHEWSLLDLAEELESKPGFGFRPPPGFD